MVRSSTVNDLPMLSIYLDHQRNIWRINENGDGCGISVLKVWFKVTIETRSRNSTSMFKRSMNLAPIATYILGSLWNIIFDRSLQIFWKPIFIPKNDTIQKSNVSLNTAERFTLIFTSILRMTFKRTSQMKISWNYGLKLYIHKNLIIKYDTPFYALGIFQLM